MDDAHEISARDRFERLHREIRTRICLLDYAPGTRLSEADLAAEFGVSRTPLRRVLARLEGEGLLHSVQGVGTFVTDAGIQALEQTYRLRLELAGLVVRLDPVTPDAATLAGLEALAGRTRRLREAPDPRAFAALNMEFFHLMLGLIGNEPLREVTERMYFQTTRIWLKSVFASRIDLRHELQIFEREIGETLDALRLGDVQAAALIQRAHLSMSFQRLRDG